MYIYWVNIISNPKNKKKFIVTPLKTEKHYRKIIMSRFFWFNDKIINNWFDDRNIMVVLRYIFQFHNNRKQNFVEYLYFYTKRNNNIYIYYKIITITTRVI